MSDTTKLTNPAKSRFYIEVHICFERSNGARKTLEIYSPDKSETLLRQAFDKTKNFDESIKAIVALAAFEHSK